MSLRGISVLRQKFLVDRGQESYTRDLYLEFLAALVGLRDSQGNDKELAIEGMQPPKEAAKSGFRALSGATLSSLEAEKRSESVLHPRV